jgi:phosphatidylserine/phosphatidylglycerophosphate/cardiolipin synthase-like enzyme
LEFQGAELKKDNNSYSMHHKIFIIDNKTVITGSFNPSANADINNDENILIIHDKKIAKKYLEEFDYLWNNYSS